MRTREGEYLHSSTPTELVRELHKMSRSPCPTDAEFMRQMAGRAALQTGKKVSCRNAEEFIGCLLAVGLLIDD
ncbi:hypothetical protein D3C83_227180 [compost metagenome]